MPIFAFSRFRKFLHSIGLRFPLACGRDAEKCVQSVGEVRKRGPMGASVTHSKGQDDLHLRAN